ncbi:MAG: hypothetical protein CR962_00395 [Gammaproteobacteria bacterium]|nr:MAG: hypothetical protein CR962_00395 [Gammaproteobacteria bacterium]
MDDHKLSLKIFMFVLLLLVQLCPVCSGKTEHVYATGTTMEIDRCASAWLIKRYVDKAAVFKFFPDDAIIKTGIAFDTPYSRLCRTHSRSTFEVIMERYNISGKRLNRIAKFIHAYEINFWNKSHGAQSDPMAEDLKQIIQNHPEPEACLSHCFSYLDKIMKKSDNHEGNEL